MILLSCQNYTTDPFKVAKSRYLFSKQLTINRFKWHLKPMGMTVEQLVSEALDMPAPIRAFVAERIIESLDVTDTPNDLSPEWKAEIERRI